jgi:hypothetical protein
MLGAGMRADILQGNRCGAGTDRHWGAYAIGKGSSWQIGIIRNSVTVCVPGICILQLLMNIQIFYLYT